MQVVAKINQNLKTKIKLENLFTGETIAYLAQIVEEQQALLQLLINADGEQPSSEMEFTI
jgi:hypothetical protein